MNICEEQQLQAVDPYPGWTQDSQGNIVVIGSQNKEQPLGSVNSNYANIFAKISNLVVDNSVNYGSMNTSDATTGKEIFANFDSIKLILDSISTDTQVASSISSSNGVTTITPSVDGVVKSFPNHIKSAIASHINPEVSTHDKSQGWTSTSKFNLNYNFLQMVQRLDGFERVSPSPQARRDGFHVNELSVLRPRWVRLTKDFYLSSRGKEIVCRLKPYICEQIGITPKPGIEAPVYDEYFIITPPVKDTIVIRSTSMRDIHRAALTRRWETNAAVGSMSRIAMTQLIIK